MPNYVALPYLLATQASFQLLFVASLLFDPKDTLSWIFQGVIAPDAIDGFLTAKFDLILNGVRAGRGGAGGGDGEGFCVLLEIVLWARSIMWTALQFVLLAWRNVSIALPAPDPGPVAAGSRQRRGCAVHLQCRHYHERLGHVSLYWHREGRRDVGSLYSSSAAPVLLIISRLGTKCIL